MRERARLVRGLVSGLVTLWAAAAGAQEPTTAALTWDQEEVSATALELDAVLATASFDLIAPEEVSDEGDAANAARAVAHVEQLAAEVEELAARLAAGEDREQTRELMNRIQNRRALLGGLASEMPAIYSPEDLAAAEELWSQLRSYYRAGAAQTTVEEVE